MIQGRQLASDAERTGVDTDLGMSRRAGQEGMLRFGSSRARSLRRACHWAGGLGKACARTVERAARRNRDEAGGCGGINGSDAG